MAASVSVKVNGIDELKKALRALPEKIRRKALVKALKAGGRVVQKAARAAIPELAAPTAYRTKGLLKKRLTVRTSKESRRQGNVGVFVNIAPAAGAKYKSLGKVAGIRLRLKTKESQRGAQSNVDPYYWRWVNFGAKPHTIKAKTAKGLAFGGRVVKKVSHPGIKGVNFLQAGADALPAALAAFEREAIPAIEALNKPGA